MTYLSMCVDNWAEKFPSPSSAIHSNHSQDLEETEASEGWRRENLAVRAKSENN